MNNTIHYKENTMEFSNENYKKIQVVITQAKHEKLMKKSMKGDC